MTTDETKLSLNFIFIDKYFHSNDVVYQKRVTKVSSTTTTITTTKMEY